MIIDFIGGELISKEHSDVIYRKKSEGITDEPTHNHSGNNRRTGDKCKTYYKRGVQGHGGGQPNKNSYGYSARQCTWITT